MLISQNDNIDLLTAMQPNFSTCINQLHTIIHILDNLGSCIGTRGFGGGPNDGIESLLILIEIPYRPLHVYWAALF